MEIKGVKASVMKELSPQFILDFMQSGYFVYCGDECWDLKDRQPTAVLDKESGDYDDIYEDDEDVKKNELKDDIFIDDNIDRIQDNDEDDDENEEDEIDDDLAKAFDDFDDEYNAGLILVDDNQEEENEDDDDN